MTTPNRVPMLVNNYDDNATAEYEAAFDEETNEEGLPPEAALS